MRFSGHAFAAVRLASMMFSSTLRLPNMRRSSGTSCIPALRDRVRRLAREFCAVEDTIEPERGRTMPIRLFSVVVLPAPLRPSSATTSFFSTRRRDVEQDVRVAIVAVEAGDFEQAHGACTPPR